MNEEDQNSWRELGAKLERIESIPEETPLNRAAAWQNIHTRLHPGGKRRAIWWWAAAALFTVGTGTTALLIATHSGSEAQPERAGHSLGKQTQDVAGSAVYRRTMTDSANELPVTPDRKQIQKSAQVAAVNHGSPRTPHSSLPIGKSIAGSKAAPNWERPAVEGAIASPHPIQNSLVSSGPEVKAGYADSPREQTVAIRKPLRVIHQNELDEPPPGDEWQNNTGRNTANRPLHFFPLRWRDRQSSPADAPPARPTAVFRINLNSGD